ncbi:MAG: proline dehydrogenase family protein [Candidatus Geothermarchaeales archaeon]
MFAFLVRKWVAGEHVWDAIDKAIEYNTQKVSVLVNELGEHIRDEGRVRDVVKEYLDLLDIMKQRNIDGCISVKLTQLGLEIDREYCYENTREIVGHAGENKKFVWIDMEDSRYTDDTLDIYLRLLGKFENIAVCIQSNLRRSEGDVEEILARGGKIRLVKGGYRENPRIAYDSRERIEENIRKLMRLIFERGDNFAIATHDDKLIYEAVELNRVHNKNVEFQMLMGIRDDLRRRLVAEGHRVGVYLPYGKDWFHYCYRRIRERPSNILLVIRSILP